MKHIPLIVFLILISATLSSGQISIRTSVGGGPLFMDGIFENYLSGIQFELEAQLSYGFKKINGLSVETGLEGHLGRIGFYNFASGHSSGVNHDRPLDKSKKYIHHLRSVDVPLRLNYNAFGFMGVSLAIKGSYLADGYVDLPDSDQKSRSLNYNKLVPVGEAGLFFPIGNYFVISANGSKALKDRFFDEYHLDSQGKKVPVGPYTDYGFLLRMSYKWK